jgi:hypothetical protein
VGVRFGSGGSGWIGLRPAAGVTGAELPQRCRTGNSSEFTEFGAPRVKLTRARVWNALHGMVIYWWPRLGSGRPVETESWIGAELHGGARRRACCGRKNGPLSTTSSAKGLGERCAAHRGLGSGGAAAQGSRRRWRVAEMGRRSGKKLLQGFPWLLDSMDRLGVAL